MWDYYNLYARFGVFGFDYQFCFLKVYAQFRGSHKNEDFQDVQVNKLLSLGRLEEEHAPTNNWETV